MADLAAQPWLQAPIRAPRTRTEVSAAKPWQQAPALGATPVQPGRQAQDLADAIVAGVQNSATGLALRGKLPEQVLGEDAPWYHHLGAGAASVVADFPLSIAGAVAGGAAGTAVAPGIGTVIGGGAGAFAAPMALREALVTAYNHNNALSWSGVWDIALATLKGGAKGAVIGGVTGGAGRLAAPLLAPAGAAATAATGSTLAGKTVVAAGKTGAELMALTSTAAALEGHLPTARDFMDSAILLVGMKGAVAAARGLRNVYAETGRHPMRVLDDAKKHADIKASLEKGEVPRAYEPLILQERVKAAYGEPRPEFLRKSMDVLDKAQKLDPADVLKDPVKYDYVVDSATAKAVARLLADGYSAEYAKKTRGVVPNAQSALEGLKMLTGGTLPEHAAGWAGNAGEIAARVHLVRGASNFAMEKLAQFRAVPEAQRSPQMKLEVVAALDRVAMLYGEFLGVRAEAGRSLQIFGAIKRDPSFLGEAEALIHATERAKGSLDTVAALAAGFKTPAEMARFAEGFQAATTPEMMISVWKASILSGPQTHLANLMGNTAKLLLDVPESVISATLTAAERKIRGDPLTWAQYQARAAAPIIGVQLGALDGLKLAGAVMRGKQLDPSKWDVHRDTSPPGALGKATRVVFGALQAEDAVFRVPAERAKAYMLAVDRLAKEGLDPRTAEGRAQIAAYIDRPELGLSKAAGEAALASIRQAGAEAVFAQPHGPRLTQAMRSVKGTPFEYILPFLSTPANLFSWAVQHTPGLNFLSNRWRADFAAGGERRNLATARVLMGAGITGVAFTLAQDGVLTGNWLHLTPEQKAAKLAAGEQPNSFKIGDKYYSHQRMEPISKVLSIAADLSEIGRHAADKEDKAKIAMLLIAMFGNATISANYMAGLSNAMQTLTDPVRFSENFFEQYAMSLVPKIIGQTAVIMDPDKREIDGIVDAIQSQIPILRERLLPQRDAWGEPRKNERLFEVLPIATSEASKDKVRTEAARLSIAISSAPKFFTAQGPFNPTDKRIKLTPLERNIMDEVSGKKAMEILAPLVNSPSWDRLPEYVKVSIYKEVLEDARKYGAYKALPPDAPKRLEKQQKIIDRIRREQEAAQPK